ncbi:MAG: proline dehydrogenase family protein [Candidatus Hydrothermales bacterium]
MFREIFLYLSQKQNLKNYVEKFPPSKKLVERFVAGETLSSAVKVIRNLNELNMTCTVDKLGESLTDEDKIKGVVKDYKTILKVIKDENLNSTISLKLTHLGLMISDDLAYKSLSEILEYAKELNIRVCIDMENSPFTQRTLDIYERAFNEFGNVGVAIQSYLKRTISDLERLSLIGAEVRICKGAYKEPKEIAYQRKKEVDENFKRALLILFSNNSLNRGTYPCVATHDEKLINFTFELVKKNNILPDKFEFQMLYGIRRDLQEKIVKAGYRVRIYVPFGSEWYAYFMRRLGERPANLFFILKNIFKP